ncbi:hypothetical protein AVEN_215896-1 [Araneus ventricosus]|uniref:Uncharacterized protein n=1 Tax=Araneus ventricosus TaxID=182803 RepID=A0A4Y2X5P0_ARAVE|nr:hypothetical protein AVEN_161656-1 [Araneus ventricosus]GBO44932.1 hypothetical protein AVEN_215896-1 [Araneus ventricosus]
MIKQKSKFRPPKGSTEKIKVLSSFESSLSESDDIFQSQASTSATPVDKLTTTNSTVDYTLLSRTCDRCGVSHRAGAAITTAVLRTSTSEIYTYKRQCLCVCVCVCLRAMSRRIYRTYNLEIWHTGSRNGDSMHLEAEIFKFNLEKFLFNVLCCFG